MADDGKRGGEGGRKPRQKNASIFQQSQNVTNRENVTASVTAVPQSLAGGNSKL
jgi:hypothetical protein